MLFNQFPKKIGKKKWETPRFEIIDSAQPQSGTHKGFVERGIQNSKYYIAPNNNPAAKFTAGKVTYMNYYS